MSFSGFAHMPWSKIAWRTRSWPAGGRISRRCGYHSISFRTNSFGAAATPVTGVAERILLAAPTAADGHHESVGFHYPAVGHLDSDGSRYQDGAFGYHAYPGHSHGLSARITTSSSSRQPGCSRPISVSHPARA